MIRVEFWRNGFIEDYCCFNNKFKALEFASNFNTATRAVGDNIYAVVQY